jgi:hypothetical protein
MVTATCPNIGTMPSRAFALLVQGHRATNREFWLRVAYIQLADLNCSELPPTGRNSWRDDGLCVLHDGKLSFIQQRDGLSFPDATRKIAEDWGVA